MGDMLSGEGGLFNAILGTSGLGLTGGVHDNTQTTTMDPITQALATLRLQSIEDALNSMGGWQGLMSNMYTAGENYFNNIMAPQTSQQYGLMGLARSGGRQEALAKGSAQVGQQNFLAQLQALSGLINQSPYAPQPKVNQTGTDNPGLISSVFGSGGSGGQAVGGLAAAGLL